MYIYNNFYFVSCLTAILFFSCNSNKRTEVQYKLKDAEIQINEYALSLDGRCFFYLSRHHLFCFDLNKNAIDSIKFNYDNKFHYNFLSGLEGIMILSLNKIDSYRIDTTKSISLEIFNRDLEVTNSTRIHVNQNEQAILEDFNFNSYYHDNMSNLYYFNNSFGYMASAKDNVWNNNYKDNSFADPTNGTIYFHNSRKLGADVIFSNKGAYSKIAENTVLPKTFSVIEDKIMYYNNKRYYYKRNNDLNWKQIDTNLTKGGFRWKEGIYNYRVDENILKVIRLFQ
jgi:hypothetical protein